ncbi:DSTYK [Mytilus coruscus]|uniref:Dual serine/threonine and tyrosine protein kinase n=1 Tax=Mytilus coruscus TaxID=42192 RepID=A0A6J8AD07_MYTCO|nr:DSTYK [Mytilus coruscus]
MTSLSAELNRFCEFSKRTKQILDETKSCFDDINESGNSELGSLFKAELLREEEQEILDIAQRPPGIVILGQNSYSKFKIVNEIFNNGIFPVINSAGHDDLPFRMVRFRHGESLSYSLALPDDYEIVDHLDAYREQSKTVPLKDLQIHSADKASDSAILEISYNHVILRQGAQIIVAPSHGEINKVYKTCTESVSPILVYSFSDDLSDEEIETLQNLQEISQYESVCFIRVPKCKQYLTNGESPNNNSTNLTTDSIKDNVSSSSSRKIERTLDKVNGNPRPQSHSLIGKNKMTILKNTKVYEQLCDLGYLNENPTCRNTRRSFLSDYYETESDLIDNFESHSYRFNMFVQQTLQRYLVNSSTVLNNSHSRCLSMFIMSAFDMARDMLITPKKLMFAREKEVELYKSLMRISVAKTNEIREMIGSTIAENQNMLVQKAADYEFLGTLSRCLESLERIDKDHANENSTSEALKQIVNAAYQVEISLQSSSSFVRTLFERMKQLVQSMPWNSQPKIDLEWKKKLATDILSNLSEARLAKSISGQIKERLNKSHDAFAMALRQLEQKHTGRLDKIEEERLKLRKIHAPKVAKVALESTSIKDTILHGMPHMGREIGRGQYGVVYSCDSWAGCQPCAIKSVVPPDEKHWNDLALEFYYTKNIPEHERVVALRGSVIDYTYGGGTNPAVLLVMDRLVRDLYGAIKQGLDWISRLVVAVDVVEGMRFLHSQGLVHRDIKLKNVLLDKANRAKITDLGFCKPEAMMSGSIVGTPIHMAPELFTGRYDNSVDVYAFGILFWYICAGHVKLPTAFERCDNKDHLWTGVKKGLRPERLAVFDTDCWELMQECWDGEPLKRPLLGDVQTRCIPVMQLALAIRYPAVMQFRIPAVAVILLAQETICTAAYNLHRKQLVC